MKTGIRSIENLIEPQQVLEGAGVRLRRSIAGRALNYLDPFLLFDHFGSDDPRDYMAGFPMHPHRGIETVTYMLEGAVRHGDTLGNAGTIHGGDVQWMTAGGGIMHEEMPEPVDGRMEGFQLWVNLPARLKMSRPRYREIKAGAIPRIERPDGTVVRVVAGSVDGVAGPVKEIAAEPAYLDAAVPPGCLFVHPVPAGHAAFAYVFDGECRLPDGGGRERTVTAPGLAVLGDGESVQVAAGDAGARFLLVSGAPLNEPIARYGPFVMNTREEIEQALLDLENGTFVVRG